ncbi:MAG: damage-inducible protein DinB [Acidobacteria bacterium]|nr:damage-inducible protein DinB [Acidobacteriota bacterium]MCA1638535.1 damage-inducible protein DinB [Acidobacteriota bacterium]
MNDAATLGHGFLKELEAEAAVSRKCLERIPENLFDWKPHEKSMTMGYLALLVAEIPKWNALQNVSDDALAASFYLKNQGQVLYETPKKESIAPSINHLVHHRGQLTVYMRLNDIAVPSIYGPSADDRGF